MGIFSSIKNAIFGDDEENKGGISKAKATATTGPKERAAITTEEVEQRIANIPGADNLNPVLDTNQDILFLSNRDGFRNIYKYEPWIAKLQFFLSEILSIVLYNFEFMI